MWPVVPLCKRQLLDVSPEDILNSGLYRLCDTYKSGGGYDKFPEIYEKRTGVTLHNSKQFVVQLRGCPLSCPYCYVTPEGINAAPVMVPTSILLDDYFNSDCLVFHLMGGAPALYLKHWHKLHKRVSIFHSDLLLVEGLYDMETLFGLRGLHAVSVKSKSIYSRKQLELFWKNLDTVTTSGIEFYITFTGDPEGMDTEIRKKYPAWVLKDSFYIDIINYEAINDTNVQEVPSVQ